MSSSLLLQQCPACLVRLTWIFSVMGGMWPYGFSFMGCCRQDLFNIDRNIYKHRYICITPLYIYIYIYILNSFDSLNLDCDPWVSWSFLQNNNNQAVKKMKWIENRKNTVKIPLGFFNDSFRLVVNMWVLVSVCVYLWGL